MHNLAGKFADVKIWGRGNTRHGHRHFVEVGKQMAKRAYNRAVRKLGKQEARRA